MNPVPLKCVYVLHGDDAHLRDEARQAILSTVLGDADPQTCVTSFDAEAELADVLDELRTVPLLGGHRVVIVRDADAFISANRQAMETYLESPSKTASLVLMVLGWNKTHRIAKAVAKVGHLFDCTAPDPRNLGRWLVHQASQGGKTLAPDAAELMVEWVGAELAILGSELEKLSLYVGDRDRITPDDVAAVVTATAGPAAFALTNAVTAQDPAAALKALAGMLTTRGEEFKTLGLIGWHLRKVLAAQQLAAAGQRPDAGLRMPPAQKRVFLEMLKRRPAAKIQGDFRKLIAADLAMKSGTPPRAALQDLVVALCT